MLNKLKIDLERLLPPGYDPHYEELAFGWGFLAAFLYSFSFIASLSRSIDYLYIQRLGERQLIPGAVMPDFVNVLGSSLVGFAALAVIMLAFAAVHYSYHYKDSKSIYLMRRLPNSMELHKRCWSVPLIAAANCVIAALILLHINLVIYLLATPKACLTPQQWLKIWRAIL